MAIIISASQKEELKEAGRQSCGQKQFLVLMRKKVVLEKGSTPINGPHQGFYWSILLTGNGGFTIFSPMVATGKGGSSAAGYLAGWMATDRS